MGLKSVWVWLIFMFISLQGWRIEGCLEQERIALLQLRQFFNRPNYLRDWVDGDGNSDCCRWESVECSNTSRVIRLYLGYTRSRELGEWYLNVSLFSSFEELQQLDLTGNLIAGFITNEGFERSLHLSNLQGLYLGRNRLNDSSILSALTEPSSLKNLSLAYNELPELNNIDVSRLSNLEFVNLGGNKFNNSILSSLTTLSSIKGLRLYDNGLTGAVDLQEWKSLSNLEEVDMSHNKINKILFPKGLRKLNYLSLRNISISDGSILLQSLGSFPTLKTVNLSFNNFSGINNTCELHKFANVEEFDFSNSLLHINLFQIIEVFTSLKSLDISYCKLNGILTDLPTLKNLKYLDMHSTVLNNNFVQFIGSLASLEYLSLTSCNLTNTFLATQGICRLLHLKELYMEKNDLGGNLSWCLSNLTSLQVLDISSNHFTENISSSPLKALTTIQDLRLSNNHFQIPISLEPFFNHTKLKTLHAENNHIYAGIEQHSLVPKFQLNSILFSGCDSCSFPEFLYSQYELQEVHLSHINFTGEFPNWLLDSNTKLKKLYLINCSLSGIFQLPVHSHMHLKELDISINFIHGHIPTEIGAYLPMLESFNISRNGFSGSIPSSFGDMNSLESLDLSNNLLNGEIPEHLTMGCSSLQLLVLSNNSLQGQIFSDKFNLNQLSRLQLNSNNFSGKIPDCLSNSLSITGLYLSNNNLSGTMPRWLGNMSNLVDIIMPNNHLEGLIPLEFCQLGHLEILDLSGNNITGSLPSCFSPSSIKQVHLSKNKFQGQLNDAFSNSTSLITLDLGYNHFDGNIPSWIGSLPSLTYLILSNNKFQGEVPIELCQLTHLHLIDLSHNQISGHIPNCLNITIIPAFNSSPVSFATALNEHVMRKDETVEFTTKNISYFYRGRVLSYMYGIDLSCNKLTGTILDQIGNLVGIHTLNLSHNILTGSIPLTFSLLTQVESLDLSYNNLSGIIPAQLVDLTALAVFSVAYNNLSGKIPDRTAQFGTFEASSYEGNPFLCGLPLPKSCNAIDSPSFLPNTSIAYEEDVDFMDINIFYISFAVSYTIALLGIVVLLYINPHWRHAWFYCVETWMTSCYYFVVDHLPM